MLDSQFTISFPLHLQIFLVGGYVFFKAVSTSMTIFPIAPVIKTLSFYLFKNVFIEVFWNWHYYLTSYP